MPDQKITIVCPHCSKEISVDEALQHQFDTQIKTKIQEQAKEELEKQKELLKVQSEKEREEMRAKMKDFLEKKEKEASEERKKIEEEVKSKFLEEKDAEVKNLKQELDKARELELKIRQEKNQLDEEKRSFELEKQRQLDSEREKIRKSAEDVILDQVRLKEAEKDKQLDDMRKKIEELQLKANVTSQQLQGEVLELELEQILRAEFPYDEILPVAKGVNGADVMQRVHDQTGKYCGTIIWESKRTKNWDEKWVQKLKDDQRSSKSDVAILVTSVLPSEIKNFGPKDSVYVTNFESLLGITKLLRNKIIELCYARQSTVGKEEKKEILWNYLTGNEFKQRVEAIVEAFNLMKADIEKEKQWFMKKWARTEKNIQQVVSNTIGMHGDLQGLMGTSLPEIESIELTTVETLETVDSTEIYQKQTSVTFNTAPQPLPPGSGDNFTQSTIDDILPS